MTNMTHILRRSGALVVAGAAAFAGFAGANAQVTEDANITVTLDNALSLTENTPVDFGTLTIIQDAGQANTATLGTDGTFTDTSGGNAVVLQIAAGTAGDYSIDTGVPNFTNVGMSFTTAGTTLSAAGAPPTNDTLAFDTIVVDAVAGTITSACADTAGTSSCSFTTDATGVFQFNLGGTLTGADGGEYQATGTVYTGTLALTTDFE